MTTKMKLADSLIMEKITKNYPLNKHNKCSIMTEEMIQWLPINFTYNVPCALCMMKGRIR